MPAEYITIDKVISGLGFLQKTIGLGDWQFTVKSVVFTWCLGRISILYSLPSHTLSNLFILFLGGGLGAGWRLLDNGTYIRIYDSRSTSGGSAGGSAGSGGSGSGGISVGSVNNNLNTIIGAAQGPGDYHGTISKSELEKEAEGAIFSSDTDETKNQIENTR